MQHPFLYPLPSFLKGVLTVRQYGRWLNAKANTIFGRDRKHGRPYALKSSEALYQALINLAVVNGGEFDPYTGEKLAWELISTWAGGKTANPQEASAKSVGKYALLPTIDHKNPAALDFEIVSWRVNSCKNYLTPPEFIALCQCVARHRSKKQRA